MTRLKLSNKMVTIDCYEMKLCRCTNCGVHQAVKFSTLYGKLPTYVSWFCKECGAMNHDGKEEIK